MKNLIKKSFIIFLALVILTSTLTACSGKNRKVVGTVGAYEVYYEELRWLTMQYKDIMASTYGEDIWKNKDTAEQYREELEERVYSSIISNYVILTLCDDDMLQLNGVKLIDINGSEVQGIVDNYVNETITDLGGKANYKQSLKENYLTDSLYRFINGVDVCESILFNYYCSLRIIDDSDEAAIDYIYENFIHTVHIYISKGEGEESQKLANALKIKLEKGEDIHELAKKYSEDQTMDSQNGRYFTHNTYAEEYEKAAFALEMNQISDIVETSTGYYIIQRLPMDDAYIGANYTANLKDQYLLAVFDKAMEERKTELSFVPNEFGSSIDLVKMK